MFLEDQIRIWEWFLKDHVTLKTGVMAAEISAFLNMPFLNIKISAVKWLIASKISLFT